MSVAKDEPLLFVMLAQFFHEGKIEQAAYEQALYDVKLARFLVQHEINHLIIQMAREKKL